MSKTIVWIEDDVDIIGPLSARWNGPDLRSSAFGTAKEVFDNIPKLHDADLILLDMLLPEGGVESGTQQIYRFGYFQGIERKTWSEHACGSANGCRQGRSTKSLRELGLRILSGNQCVLLN